MYTMWQLIETQSTWLQNHCIARLERSITSPSMAGGGGVLPCKPTLRQAGKIGQGLGRLSGVAFP